MTINFQSIIDDAIYELKHSAINDPDTFYQGDPGDVIHELTDSAVPVYTRDLLDLAADFNFLATAEPELGPAFDGSATPINIIAANVYEWIYNALWQSWNDEIEEIYDRSLDIQGMDEETLKEELINEGWDPEDLDDTIMTKSELIELLKEEVLS
jgi:hypothetical protein